MHRVRLSSGRAWQRLGRLREPGVRADGQRARGFVAYCIINGGEGTVASASVCEGRAGADESTRRAAEWVAGDLAELAVSGPEVVADEGATLTERDGYEHGVPCWVDTWQEDPDTAATFYAGVFDCENVQYPS